MCICRYVYDYKVHVFLLSCKYYSSPNKCCSIHFMKGYTQPRVQDLHFQYLKHTVNDIFTLAVLHSLSTAIPFPNASMVTMASSATSTSTFLNTFTSLRNKSPVFKFSHANNINKYPNNKLLS